MLIVCNGMIRSGSTLQYNLVRYLVETTGLGKAKGYLRPEQLDRLKNQLEFWARDRDRLYVVKSHNMIPNYEFLLEQDLVKICYTYRDIRDVAVSAKEKFTWYQEDMNFQFLDDVIANYYSLKGLPNILWQKYENMIFDLPGSVNSIANHLNLTPSEAIISYIVEECSLETSWKRVNQLQRGQRLRQVARKLLRQTKLIEPVKVMLENSGIPESIWRGYDSSLTLLQEGHISNTKGKVGRWKTELSSQQVQMLEERYGNWLLEAGYFLG
jgi:hypothetical protein